MFNYFFEIVLFVLLFVMCSGNDSNGYGFGVGISFGFVKIILYFRSIVEVIELV